MGEDHSSARRKRIKKRPGEDIIFGMSKSRNKRRPRDTAWCRVWQVEPRRDLSSKAFVAASLSKRVSSAALSEYGLIDFQALGIPPIINILGYRLEHHRNGESKVRRTRSIFGNNVAEMLGTLGDIFHVPIMLAKSSSKS